MAIDLDVRVLTVEDSPILARLSQETFREPTDPPWGEELFRERLRVGREARFPFFTGWLAWKETVPVGFIFVQVFESVVDVQKLATHPSFRRQGVARMLMEQCGGTFPQHAVELEVAANNTAAYALYLSLGFQMRGRQRRVYGANTNVLLMRKEPSSSECC